MVYASSIIGNAMDFIKQYPSMTFEDYFWKYSAPMIMMMSSDGTYTRYLSEKAAKKYWTKKKMKETNYDDLNAFQDDLRLPTIE